MNIQEAQSDMHRSYYGGAPGVLVSGLIWIGAGLAGWWSTPLISLAIFFFGGMFIYPLGLFIAQRLGRSGRAADGNPLTGLAMESTALLFVGLFVAWMVFQVQANWFYPITLLAIGARYLIFKTVYGNRIYWALGGMLLIAGMITFLLSTPFYLPALAGGIIELVMAGALFKRMQRA
ncbi:MAG: hypothetical protein WA952_10050 [Lewinella sp.]